MTNRVWPEGTDVVDGVPKPAAGQKPKRARYPLS